jgi:hypothetical protein
MMLMEAVMMLMHAAGRGDATDVYGERPLYWAAEQWRQVDPCIAPSANDGAVRLQSSRGMERDYSSYLMYGGTPGPPPIHVPRMFSHVGPVGSQGSQLGVRSAL